MNKIPEEEYKKILEKMPICCVDLVINHAGKVLLVWRNNKPAKDKWWLPGGRVFKNERIIDAALRKGMEEVGIKVKIEKQIGVLETIFDDCPFPDLKTGVHTINVVYLARPEDDNPKIKIDQTIGKYRWIDHIEEELDDYVKQMLDKSEVFK